MPTSRTANVWPVIGTGVKGRPIETCAAMRDEARPREDEQHVRQQARAREDRESESGGFRPHARPDSNRSKPLVGRTM